MLIIRPNFNSGMKKYLSCIALCFFLAGCVSIPIDVLRLPPDNLAKRQQQTRQYINTDEEKIMSACTGVLQDLGFTIDKGESKLGVIFASKDRKVDNGGQLVAATLMTALAAAAGTGTSSYYNNVEKNQKIRASVVSQKSSDGSKVLVRVSFQRMFWTMAGQLSRIETLQQEDLYQGFFEGLTKSVFLEEQKI